MRAVTDETAVPRQQTRPARRRETEDKPPVQRDAPAGDFVELYRNHYRRVMRALELGGLTKPAAEDATQEAFARTLAHWVRVRDGSNPPGYVYRTAFRLARRSFRREEPLSSEPAALGDLSSDLVSQLSAEAVIQSMPRRRRACVVLCLVVGLTTKEAAAALGIAEGTVRKQIERGRSDLSQLLVESD